jgi:glutamate 5-kinase
MLEVCSMDREQLRQSQRCVIKVGTGVLTREDGRIDQRILEGIAAQCAEAISARRSIAIVSSGAIALGMRQLGLQSRPKRMDALQACAAAGQGQLIRLWSEAFAPHERIVAQILLTHADLADRQRFLNARRCMTDLQSRGAIPVINENDTVAIEEIAFGDNDSLAAQVANLVNADLLVMLSVTPGLLDGKRRIPAIAPGDRSAESLVRSEKSSGGSGGMSTKLAAARSAASRGSAVVIAAGKEDDVLRHIIAGDDVGTFFSPADEGLRSRAHWIAHTLRPKGTIVVDDGAAAALIERNRSLLPSGVVSVTGDFSQGDPVDLADPHLRVFARGLSTYSSSELESIRGKRSSEIFGILRYHLGDEVVHKDDLVILDRDAATTVPDEP